jgi:hypothetical protein
MLHQMATVCETGTLYCGNNSAAFLTGTQCQRSKKKKQQSGYALKQNIFLS